MGVCVVKSLRENGGVCVGLNEEDEWLKCLIHGQVRSTQVNVSQLIKPPGQRKSKLVNKISLWSSIFARVVHGGHTVACMLQLKLQSQLVLIDHMYPRKSLALRQAAAQGGRVGGACRATQARVVHSLWFH